MYGFITENKSGKTIFLKKKYAGIYRIKEKNQITNEEKQICNCHGECFYVWQEAEDKTNMIVISDNNEIFYYTFQNDTVEKFLIGNILKDIDIKRIMVSKAGAFKNLFMSAEYNGEIILIHCTLGKNARPAIIDKMCDENFFIYGGYIYYSNKNGDLGYQDFRDSKPDKFVFITKGKYPYLHKFLNKEYILYVLDNKIYLNNKEVIKDTEISNPIMLSKKNRLIIMWKNHDFIKYIFLDEVKKNPYTIASRVDSRLFTVADENRCIYYYGGLFGNMLRIYPDLNLNEEKNNQNVKKEIDTLKEKIKEQDRKILAYKQKIKELDEIIYNLSSRTKNDDTV